MEPQRLFRPEADLPDQHAMPWPGRRGFAAGLADEAPAVAESLIQEVRRAMQRDHRDARAAALRLVAFFSQPSGDRPTTRSGGLAPWQRRKVDRYLRDNLDRPLHLVELADHLPLSVSHFCRAFRESFGTTPHLHIVGLRLRLAQHLMLTTGEPLSQIAFACGLADQAHLSRLFRRLLGETPSAWRRRNQMAPGLNGSGPAT